MEQNNSISSAYRKNFDSVQNNVSTELRSENNIAKILCTNAKATISGFEALNGELRFNGEVCFMVTYINEDGDFFTLKGSEPFNSKLESPDINVNFVPSFNVETIELKVNSTSEEVKLIATIETMVEGVVTENVNYFVNNDENIVTNCNYINYSTLEGFGKLGFNFEECFETNEAISKVLNMTANTEILDYCLGTDYFTVEGIITINLQYVLDEENKELKQYTNCYKFKEELERMGTTKEGYLILSPSINQCNIETNLEQDGDKNKIKFTLPVDVDYIYLKPNSSEVVVDAYSLTNKLNLNIESFRIDGKNIRKCFEEKIDGKLVIDDDAPRIMKFISYCGENISITNVIREENKIILEGVASVNVVYLEEDETERLNSVIIEVPFSIENRLEENENVFENDELNASAIIKDVSVRAKKGKEIDIDMDICLFVDIFSYCEDMLLSGVTIGEPLSSKEACLQIYFARKGNTLWDISKGLLTKPEKILDQNPNINLPLEKDEKIVLFKSLDK